MVSSTVLPADTSKSYRDPVKKHPEKMSYDEPQKLWLEKTSEQLLPMVDSSRSVLEGDDAIITFASKFDDDRADLKSDVFDGKIQIITFNSAKSNSRTLVERNNCEQSVLMTHPHMNIDSDIENLETSGITGGSDLGKPRRRRIDRQKNENRTPTPH
eukprot:TRINITY_DN0_c7746_g1_i1.p1 TRINITY_DN0_c7746_g1~~TRINITY_DN0_c7746_g1_i1.p1  ORF type:complete len:157 (+),score=34.70 TRINITY_DN0_c7746_g1_i1:88-558(+)